MTLLLDTCTFVWLCSAPEKLSAVAVSTLDARANDRALSLASVWEIALKYGTGKLPLPEPPDVWVEEQLRHQQIAVLPLQRPVLYRSAGLPPVHRDPFDRVIAADALERGLRVVSPDGPFKLYGCKVIW